MHLPSWINNKHNSPSNNNSNPIYLVVWPWTTTQVVLCNKITIKIKMPLASWTNSQMLKTKAISTKAKAMLLASWITHQLNHNNSKTQVEACSVVSPLTVKLNSNHNNNNRTIFSMVWISNNNHNNRITKTANSKVFNNNLSKTTRWLLRIHQHRRRQPCGMTSQTYLIFPHLTLSNRIHRINLKQIQRNKPTCCRHLAKTWVTSGAIATVETKGSRTIMQVVVDLNLPLTPGCLSSKWITRTWWSAAAWEWEWTQCSNNSKWWWCDNNKWMLEWTWEWDKVWAWIQ